MGEVEPGPGDLQLPAPKKRTSRAKPPASNSAPPDVIRKVEEHSRPAESPEERDSRLRREERAAQFGHVKESILLVAVCVVGVASLFGVFGPWLDVASKGNAFVILS